MKVISLNTWGGEAGVPALLEFFKSHQDTDVFCLQEVWNGGEEMLGEKASGGWLARRVTTLLTDITSVLPEHVAYYRPHFNDYYGIAMFIKKGLEVREEGEFYIYREKGFISAEDFGNHARILQYATIQTPKGLRTVVNLHGLWNGLGKGDSEDRLEQSNRMVSFVASRSEPVVMVGDFNLRPDTESVRMLEVASLRNLITEFSITSTRTSHYPKPEKFADYAFVSPEIVVGKFEILPDEVSDHAPLLLEFS